MKQIEKDEIYEHLSQFLKGRGIEMKNGSYEPYEWSVVVQLIDKPPLP